MPALPSNTYRTPHGFQFRIVVPEPLRSATGKREIKKSLGRDYHEAVSQSRLLALQVDRQFSELRDLLAHTQEKRDAIESFLAKPADRRLKPVTQVTFIRH